MIASDFRDKRGGIGLAPSASAPLVTVLRCDTCVDVFVSAFVALGVSCPGVLSFLLLSLSTIQVSYKKRLRPAKCQATNLQGLC